MNLETEMFRVYRCSVCDNIAYAMVLSESDVIHCSLCGAAIEDAPGTLYARTVDEAEDIMRDLVYRLRQEQSGRKVHYGLGVKRTLIEIVKSLLELNRGWPVPIEQVLQEATYAEIDLSKASKMLQQLIDEGILFEDGEFVGLLDGDIL